MKLHFLELPLDERRVYLEEAALRRSTSVAILEKDLCAGKYPRPSALPVLMCILEHIPRTRRSARSEG